MKKKKVLFISSTGGHLSELMQLKELFDKYDYFLMTEKTPSNINLREKHGKRVAFLIYGTYTSFFKKLIYPFKLFANCWISLYYFIRVRPKYIITTGAHTAGPMCCIGKMFGSKIIFIESFANVTSKTLTGRIIYKFADMFIVQWDSMLELYPKAKWVGGVF